MTYTMRSSEGKHTADSIQAVCEWQAETQGASPVLEVQGLRLDVDIIEFDPDELDAAVEILTRAVRQALDERDEEK